MFCFDTVNEFSQKPPHFGYRNFPEKFSTPMNRFIKGIRDKYPGNTNYVIY